MPACGQLLVDHDCTFDDRRIPLLVACGLLEGMTTAGRHWSYNLHAIATQFTTWLHAYMLADRQEAVARLEALDKFVFRVIEMAYRHKSQYWVNEKERRTFFDCWSCTKENPRSFT